MNRRALLLGLGSMLIAAPAIVRPEWLMPVKAVPYRLTQMGIDFPLADISAETWRPGLTCLRDVIRRRGLILHQTPPAIPSHIIARRIGPVRIVDYYAGEIGDMRRRLDVFCRDYA